MKKPFFRRGEGRFAPEPYDPETQIPIIRSSICTGEKVAGFKNKKDGHFSEVMLIRNQKDLDSFKAEYGVDKIETEY